MNPQSRRVFLCASGALWLTSSEVFAAAPVRLQIVVAKTNSLTDISIAELKQLYRGRTIPLAGHTAIPLNHPPLTPDRVVFDRIVLGMGPDEISRYWVDQKIRGGNAPPRTVESISLLVRVVARLSGGIGYVREGFTSPDLKAITIEGRSVTDAGYLLTSAG